MGIAVISVDKVWGTNQAKYLKMDGEISLKYQL